MITQPYDLIGDIHGQHDKLTALLTILGYQPGPLRKKKHGESFQVPQTWKHPESRKVIFLGDYIDRGPKVREVLLTVRGMVEAGDALAITRALRTEHVSRRPELLLSGSPSAHSRPTSSASTQLNAF